MRKIHRRINVVGDLPDDNSTLMLVARLRHIAGTTWRTHRFLNTATCRKTWSKRKWRADDAHPVEGHHDFAEDSEHTVTA